jgi:hypothetical protein
VITNGTSSASVTVDPSVDTDVETLETVEIMVASGTGYLGGSPNDATGTISNDDTSSSMPLVAITGLNHVTPDGFSFVAANDIPANTVIYFTDNNFDNTTLKFTPGDAVFQWTSPGAVIPKGDVIVVTEPSPDTFSLSCNMANGADCGNLVLISGNFAIATAGETFYAYADNDTDPTNGVVEIYATLFTGISSASGGNIPTTQDPSGIFTNAVVVDGFPATAPNRTEYDATKRALPIVLSDIGNIANWVHAQPNALLSNVPFSGLDNTAPTLVSTDPVDDATGIAIDAVFTATFDEPVEWVPGGSSITLSNQTSGFTHEAFNEGSSNVTFTGNTLSINPTTDLIPGDEYRIRINPSSVQDAAGNAFTGNAVNSWTFTTGNPIDNTPPVAVCQDIMVQLDNNGNATVSVTDIDNGSSDNEGSITYGVQRRVARVFDQNVAPEVIFGSGNANGSFTNNQTGSVELGLRAKVRYPTPMNTFNSNGD